MALFKRARRQRLKMLTRGVVLGLGQEIVLTFQVTVCHQDFLEGRTVAIHKAALAAYDIVREQLSYVRAEDFTA